MKLRKFQIFLLDLSKPLSSFVGVTMVLLQSTPTKLLQVSTLVIHNSFKIQNFHYILLWIEHLSSLELFFHMIVTTIFFYSNKQSCLSTCAQTHMRKLTYPHSHTQHEKLIKHSCANTHKQKERTLGHKNVQWHAWIWDQTHLALSFNPKTSLYPIDFLCLNYAPYFCIRALF